MRIGIDLGGTKIEGIVMDPDGQILLRRRVATPAAAGYAAVVEAVAALAESLETESGSRCTIGIGTPGARSTRTGRMKNCNSTSLNGQPLFDDLNRRLGREVRMANDANCFALSEAVDGAAAGHEVVFGVILGTGVGGGLIVGRRAHNGPNAIAGEFGHTPLEADGPPCYCGKVGCVETLLSGPSLHRDYLRGGGSIGRDAAHVVALAEADGDSHAVLAMDRYMRRFGRAMATIIDIIDPDAIVLGGGMSNAARIYRDGHQAVTDFVFSDVLETPILPAKFGDSSGVRGAAWLW